MSIRLEPALLTSLAISARTRRTRAKASGDRRGARREQCGLGRRWRYHLGDDSPPGSGLTGGLTAGAAAFSLQQAW